MSINNSRNNTPTRNNNTATRNNNTATRNNNTATRNNNTVTRNNNTATGNNNVNNRKKYNINNQIGILDPNGNKINPLTDKPYNNLEKYIGFSNKWRTLPVYDKKDEIIKSMNENNVIIARSGTGSGKTVLLPKLMLHVLGYSKPVIVTVPKRVLAKNHAEFNADTLGVKVGEQVGYYFKDERRIDENGVKSMLIFTTIGSLKSRLTGTDQELSDYGAIIIDEAHERSIATDFTFLLLKQLYEKGTSIKLVITSATLDVDRFKKYYSVGNLNVGVVNVGEKTKFPIQEYFEDKEIKKNDMEKAIIKKIIDILQTTDDGAIVVFVKSGGEGNKLCNALQSESKKLGLYPYCTQLSSGSAFDKNPITGISTTKYATQLNLWKNHPNKNENNPFMRKVVMTTNVAESSITIEDAVYVIETGKEFNDRYYPEISARTLKEEYISQGSATQRKGRAGRTSPGVCYFMYTKDQFNKFEPFPTPDIQKSDLSTELIDLLRMENVQNIGNLKIKLNELIQPPTSDFIDAALNKLNQLNLITGINDESGLSILGKMVSKFRGLSLEHAVSLIYSYNYYCKKDVIDIISLLITTDSRLDSLFKEPKDKKYIGDYEKKKKQFVSEYGDFFTLLQTYRMYQREQNEINNLNKQNRINNQINNNFNKQNRINTPFINNPSNQNYLKGGNENINNGNNILRNSKINIVNSPKRTTKKWCKENYLNDRTLSKIKSVSQKLNRTLKDVMRNKNNLSTIETDLKFNSSYLMDQMKRETNYLDFLKNSSASEHIHSNIIRALLHGFKINLAINSGKNYMTCFPLKQTSCSISPDSTSKKKKYVIYNELFQSGGSPKMNIVTNLSDELIKDRNLDDIFSKCKQKIQHNQIASKGKGIGKKDSKKKKKKKKKKKSKKKESHTKTNSGNTKTNPGNTKPNY